MVPASCPQRPGGGAEGCKGGAGAAAGDRGGRCSLSGNSGVLSAQWGRRPRILALGRGPVGSEGVENNGRSWHLRGGGALVL